MDDDIKKCKVFKLFSENDPRICAKCDCESSWGEAMPFTVDGESKILFICMECMFNMPKDLAMVMASVIENKNLT